LCVTLQSSGKSLRHRVRVIRVLQPNAVIQQTKPGRAEKTHLRSQLPGLLHSVIELPRELLLEKNYQFTSRQAVLCSAETENIDTALPRDFLWRALQCCNRIGESCAVHLQEHFVSLG